MSLKTIDELIQYIYNNKDEFLYPETSGGEVFKKGLLQACSDSKINETEYNSAVSGLVVFDFLTFQNVFNPDPLKQLLDKSPALLKYLLESAENHVESIKKARLLMTTASTAPVQTSRGPYHDAIFDFDPKEPLATLHELIRKLFSENHDINQLQANHNSGRTPLFFAAAHIKKCGDKTILLLIELGAKADIPDHNGEFPLERYLKEKYAGMTPTPEELFNAMRLFKEEQRLQSLLNQGKHNDVLAQLTLKFIPVTPDYYTTDSTLSASKSMRSFLNERFQVEKDLLDMQKFIIDHSEFFKSLGDTKSDAHPEVSAFANKLFQYIERNKFLHGFDDPIFNKFSGDYEKIMPSDILAKNKPLYDFLKSQKSEIERLENLYFQKKPVDNIGKP